MPPPGHTPPPEVAPPPPAAPPSGYSGKGPARAPGDQAKRREWKMIDRHLENRWDASSERWRQVPVEKWNWVEVPCGNEGPPPGVGDGNVAPPLPYPFSAPPEVAVIPGTYVYFTRSFPFRHLSHLEDVKQLDDNSSQYIFAPLERPGVCGR